MVMWKCCRSHKVMMHSSPRMYQCSLCPLTLATSDMMQAHLKKRHFCKREFRNKINQEDQKRRFKDIAANNSTQVVHNENDEDIADCADSKGDAKDEKTDGPAVVNENVPEGEENPDVKREPIRLQINHRVYELPTWLHYEDYYSLLYDRTRNIDYTQPQHCSYCDFQGASHIVAFHERTLHRSVLERCPLCKKPFYKLGAMGRHIALEHFKDGQLVLSTRLKHKSQDELELKKQQDNMLVNCDVCGKVRESKIQMGMMLMRR